MSSPQPTPSTWPTMPGSKSNRGFWFYILEGEDLGEAL